MFLETIQLFMLYGGSLNYCTIFGWRSIKRKQKQKITKYGSSPSLCQHFPFFFYSEVEERGEQGNTKKKKKEGLRQIMLIL